MADHVGAGRRDVCLVVGRAGGHRPIWRRCGMNYVVVLLTVFAFIYLTYVILKPEKF